MNRSAAAERRAENSQPRLHLAGPNDVDAAKAEAAAAEPVPRQRTSLYDACAELQGAQGTGQVGSRPGDSIDSVRWGR